MKKSVKLSAFLLLFALLFVFFASCSTPGEEILGRWETTIESQEYGKVKMVFHFTEEGEIFLEQKQSDEIPFSIPFGTFCVAEKGKVLIVSDEVEKEFSYKIEGEKLTLSYPDEPDLVFEKIQ